jgi:hypothetical protein
VDVAGPFGAELLDLGTEAVDGLGVGVDALLEFAVLDAQPLVGGGEVADLGGGDADDSGPLAFELGFEVGVFVGEYPAFDVGFGGELQDMCGAKTVNAAAELGVRDAVRQLCGTR